VDKSHSLTVVSPLAVASMLPSGEKQTWRIASVCPVNVDEHRDIDRTLNTACGRYVMLIVCSVEMLWGIRISVVKSDKISLSLTTNVYGRSFVSRLFMSWVRLSGVMLLGRLRVEPSWSPSALTKRATM